MESVMGILCTIFVASLYVQNCFRIVSWEKYIGRE